MRDARENGPERTSNQSPSASAAEANRTFSGIVATAGFSFDINEPIRRIQVTGFRQRKWEEYVGNRLDWLNNVFSCPYHAMMSAPHTIPSQASVNPQSEMSTCGGRARPRPVTRRHGSFQLANFTLKNCHEISLNSSSFPDRKSRFWNDSARMALRKPLFGEGE